MTAWSTASTTNTTPRFNKPAADLAWSRTMALFREKLA